MHHREARPPTRPRSPFGRMLFGRMISGRMLFVMMALGMAVVGMGCAEAPTPPRPYLEAAVEAGAWLRTTTTETPHGPAWPDDARRPEAVTPWLATGVAGPTLFYLALYEATDDPAALADARRGADHLAALLPDTLVLEGFPPANTFYYGYAGLGYVLDQAYRVTGEAAYRAAARRTVDLLVAAARPVGEGMMWHEGFNDLLFGPGGTGLFLLYAAREMDHPEARAVAVGVGRALLARSVAEGGGRTWPFRADRDIVLPNFSHGAAGNGFFLATLYQETGDPVFLEAALGAARYLQSIAHTEEGGFRVPYGWPNAEWDGYFDVGWAHGPAGTARLFQRLFALTGDEQWADLVTASARGIAQSGLPGAPNPGFGDEPFKPDRRFGIASVAAFYLGRYRATEDPAYLDEARRLVDHLLALAQRDAGGLRWVLPRYSFMADAGTPAAFTGYFYGPAGYGLLLLDLDAAERGTRAHPPFPDDPF